MFCYLKGRTGLLRLCSLLLVLLISTGAFASTSSRPGGSGMTWMRTADTLEEDELIFYDQLGVDTYVILNSNLNDFDTFNTIGVNYGLFNPLELGLQTTWIANDQHNTSGIKSYKGIIKLNIFGDRKEDNYAVTLSGFQTVAPADASSKIASGEIEKGVEINASYYGKDLNMHLTLGNSTADAKYYDPDVQYFSVEKRYLNLGFEFLVSDRYTFGLEAIQEEADDPMFDKNQIFAFSLQYKPKGKWFFDFGAAFGIPEDRSEPAKSFYAGFNYRYDSLPEQPRSRSTTKKQLDTRNNIPVPKNKDAGKPVFNKRPPVKIQSPPVKTEKKFKYSVRIKNATGSKATAKRVAEFLRNNGYGVESIREVTRRSNTEIRYLKRNSKQALRLALKIPGNQDLRVMSSLARGVDFELVIGSDIVANIR